MLCSSNTFKALECPHYCPWPTPRWTIVAQFLRATVIRRQWVEIPTSSKLFSVHTTRMDINSLRKDDVTWEHTNSRYSSDWVSYVIHKQEVMLGLLASHAMIQTEEVLLRLVSALHYQH